MSLGLEGYAAMAMSNVIDARALFTAKRQLTHAYLITGNLQRALPQGGTVKCIHEFHPTFSDEDWSWLEQFGDPSVPV